MLHRLKASGNLVRAANHEHTTVHSCIAAEITQYYNIVITVA